MNNGMNEKPKAIDETNDQKQKPGDVIDLNEQRNLRGVDEMSASERWDDAMGGKYHKLAIQGLSFEEFGKVLGEMSNEVPISHSYVVKGEFRKFWKTNEVLGIMTEFVNTGGSNFFESLPETLQQISMYYRSQLLNRQLKDR